MKKKDLKHIAALGLMGGLMACSLPAQADDSAAEIVQIQNCQEPSQDQVNQLFSSLNQQSQNMYNSMNCEGKNLAMKLANAKPGAKNSCAGLNACKGGTDGNSCAGQSSCAGKAPGYFKDKNDAVKVAQKAMEKKRTSMLNKKK